MKKKLIILDLSKKYEINRQNVDVIYLSYGDINLKKYLVLNLNKFRNNSIKKKLLKFLDNYLKFINIHQKYFDICELEISNLRNDKIKIFDHILNLIILKKYYLKRYDLVEIIFDNSQLNKSYSSFKHKNIKLINLDNNKQKKINFRYFILKRFNFFLRAFVLVFFSKFFFKKFKKKSKEVNLSIYPLLNKRNIYLKNNNYLNFLITDETHLNLNLFEKFKLILKLSKEKTIISSEKFISYYQLFNNFLISFKFKKIISHYNENNYYIDGIEIGSALKKYLVISIINRLKLQIYDEGIKKIFFELEIKKFNFFMFEYNFGFYLVKKIRNIKNFISIDGYQHGIFSKNLFWFDYLIYKKKILSYIPDQIISTNKYSYNDYLAILKNKIKIKFNKNFTNTFKDLLPKIKKKSNKILVILGQHDIQDLIMSFLNNKRFKKYLIFYKFHPRTNINLFNHYKLNIVKNFKKINFKKIFISQTSTLLYDYSAKKIDTSIVEIDYRSNISNLKFLKKNHYGRK